MAVKPFMDKDFLLETETAKIFYHNYAAKMPIIDYHCHLSPQELWEDQPYENLTQLWLGGDHYKWRAMRSNGVTEEYITGNAEPFAKFNAWAETVPQCLGNPLYHWTHLELQRYFNIYEPFSSKTAESVWEKCNSLLQHDGFTPRALIEKSSVEMIATTDDPCDSLEYHQKLANDSSFQCQVMPSFRPDQGVDIEKDRFISWLGKLGEITGKEICTVAQLKQAFVQRLDHFAENGCSLADHGMDAIYYCKANDVQIESIFAKRLKGKDLSQEEIEQYKTALWVFLGEEYGRRGWVMQLHIGAQRSNSKRMLRALGPDTGFDSIGDAPVAKPLAGLLNRLEEQKLLPKTILYTLNAKDNDVLATMLGNFQGGGIPGKIQFGSGWWFHDQKDGMMKQMTSLANLGLISRFIGMLTDSRSFISYPRHEYFRRILCNLIGTWVENGEYPSSNDGETAFLGAIIENICYYNVKNYLSLN